ncbi:hypothetical protein [Nocardia jejuensis]|uniref:hypothetical protein n=1 Tax=Nocardia jejuensis TaxID=328049 RepID=UPI000835B48C|nr:hypothetical protein [Nocardia jejuensis]
MQRCLRYTQDLGLPAFLEPGTRRILLDTNTVGAVLMPWQLGRTVAHRLRWEGQLGPVILHPHSDRSTFLTQPLDEQASDGPASDLSLLVRMNVGIASRRVRVVLPSPVDEDSGFRIWLGEPNLCLPSQRAVFDALTGAVSVTASAR